MRTAMDKGDEAMGRVAVEFLVMNNRDLQMAESGALAPEKVRSFQLTGIADSGSTHLVLPTDVADRLGFPSAGEITMHCADRRTAKRRLVSQVEVELLGRRSTFRAVLEPDRTTALIGAIVLEDLDLLVDCSNNKLRPRDPTGENAEAE